MNEVAPVKDCPGPRKRPALPLDQGVERDGFRLLADAWVMLAAAGCIGLAGYLSIPDPADLGSGYPGPNFVHASSDAHHENGAIAVRPICNGQTSCIAHPTMTADNIPNIDG